MSLLTVAGLSKRFGGVVAADGVSFTLEAGEIAAIIGPNGAGKSTVFNMIGGQLTPDAGTIHLDGKRINGLPPRAIWRRGVGRTFQIAATFPSMTLAENVQTALLSHERELYSLWKGAHRMHYEHARALLSQVGMEDAADQACGTLAYGDIKRVELAIALAGDPRLLLMDEPTAGMAPGERLGLMDLVASVVRDRKITVLFTEHDMDVVFSHADRILVLDQGEVIADGSPEFVQGDARVRKIYLGPAPARAATRRR